MTESGTSRYAPLADRMRPRALAEFAGQSHLLGAGKPLRAAIEQGHCHSMVFWGPPGTGKTTLARLIAARVEAHLEAVSAVLAGVKEIRAAIARAEAERAANDRDTIVFVDEVHRFNKAQQDAFLPHVENGTILLIGATTENPSFELNNALLSRCRVYTLKALTQDDIRGVVERALADAERGLGGAVALDDDARELLVQCADGDARRALNLLEIAADLAPEGRIDTTLMREVAAGGTRRFDKGGEYFYDQISALHKAVRGSSPDAALYWLVRMLDGGCDPLYIARRVVRMASEDIGNADPRALRLALDAWEVQERLGSPEGELTLAQAVIYMAVAAKSNAVYTAFGQAFGEVRAQPSHEVPLRLRNAPTRLMKELDYGAGYRYAHDEADAFAAGESYFPDELGERQYYRPTDRGLERQIGEKLRQLRAQNAAARRGKPGRGGS